MRCRIVLNCIADNAGAFLQNLMLNVFTDGSFILFSSRSHWMLKDEFFHMNRTIPKIPKLPQQDSGSFQTHLNENAVANVDGH